MRDIITGTEIDPTQREWFLQGSFGVPGLGFGPNSPVGAIRINDRGEATYSIGGIGTPTAIPGNLTILSCSPFHAIATFQPGSNSYPDVGNTVAGDITLEFTE